MPYIQREGGTTPGQAGMKAPARCDICKNTIAIHKLPFVDGRTRMGPWADMCLECHKRVGCGLGIGNGQRYEWQESTPTLTPAHIKALEDCVEIADPGESSTSWQQVTMEYAREALAILKTLQSNG